MAHQTLAMPVMIITGNRLFALVVGTRYEGFFGHPAALNSSGHRPDSGP